MIAVLLSILPLLLWDEGPATAPQLQKAGIQEIAVTRDANAWSSTGITTRLIDTSKLTRLNSIGIDYQIGAAGATAAPWVESNLWRMIRDPGAAFLYDVEAAALPLAIAEAYAGGARSFFQVKPEHLDDFAAAYRFLKQLEAPTLSPRVNFTLFDDHSPEIDEVMNLLVRRNLLFETTNDARGKHGAMEVRIGSPEYPKTSGADPFVFAAMVRQRIGDPNRLVRVYGSETVLVRIFGDGRSARLHLLQYGDHAVRGLRVRVLGKYPRIRVSAFGQSNSLATDVVVENAATEFTVPELGVFAIVDLESP